MFTCRRCSETKFISFATLAKKATTSYYGRVGCGRGFVIVHVFWATKHFWRRSKWLIRKPNTTCVVWILLIRPTKNFSLSSATARTLQTHASERELQLIKTTFDIGDFRQSYPHHCFDSNFTAWSFDIVAQNWTCLICSTL